MTKLIPIRNSQKQVIAHAQVSDEDHEWAAIYSWHLTGGRGRGRPYPSRSTAARKTISLHTEVWERLAGPIPPGMDIDHMDGDSFNAVRTNLRLLTRAENASNRRSGNSNASSKYRGVGWSPAHKKWKAYVGKDWKLFYLGVYEDERVAASVAMAYRLLFCPASIEPGEIASELSDLMGTTPPEMKAFLQSVMTPRVFDRQPWDESPTLRHWLTDPE